MSGIGRRPTRDRDQYRNYPPGRNRRGGDSQRSPVQGSLVDQALAAIAGYEVEMVPVVLHHRIAHVHAFTDGLAAPELTRDSQAGTELTAVFRWVQKKERSLNG